MLTCLTYPCLSSTSLLNITLHYLTSSYIILHHPVCSLPMTSHSTVRALCYRTYPVPPYLPYATVGSCIDVFAPGFNIMSACASNACNTVTSYVLLSGKSHAQSRTHIHTYTSTRSSHTLTHLLTHTHTHSSHAILCHVARHQHISSVISLTIFHYIYFAKHMSFFLQLTLTSFELIFHHAFYFSFILPFLCHIPSSLSFKAFLFPSNFPFFFLSFFLLSSLLP